MDTAQLFFRTRAAKNDEEALDKVQSYLAALLHNGQIVGGHTPMAKINGGYWVTASLPEPDSLADRFANKWVRQRLRELAAVGVDRPKVTHLGTDPESRALYRRHDKAAFGLAAAALGLLVVSTAITLSVNVPIDGQIAGWTVENLPVFGSASGMSELYHGLRTALTLVGAGCLFASALSTHHGQRDRHRAALRAGLSRRN